LIDACVFFVLYNAATSQTHGRHLQLTIYSLHTYNLSNKNVWSKHQRPQVPGFVNERGSWPRQLQTMLVDGFAIVIGSVMGVSPLTVFAESAVPIRVSELVHIPVNVRLFGI
jgi:hypothetical protein